MQIRSPRSVSGIAAWVASLGAVAVGALVIGLWLLAGSDHRRGVLEVEVDRSKNDAAALWLNFGRGFSTEYASVVYPGLPHDTQVLRFPLAGNPVRLRFSPFRGAGSATIRRIRFRRGSEGELRDIPLVPIGIHEVARVARDGTTLHLQTTEQATQSWIELLPGGLRSSGPLAYVNVVTPTTIVIAGLALLILGGAGFVMSARTATRLANAPRIARARLFLALMAVVFIVAGAKLQIARGYAPRVPFLDAWSGEAIATFLPFGWGQLHWGDLFSPHYEHRIALTRALDLFLLTINGQWDELVQSMVNAWLHSLVLCALILLLWSGKAARSLDALCVAGVAVCALPFTWQNTLAGFQSGFHLQMLTLLLPLAIVPYARPWSAGWLVGIALLALGLFSLGGGILNPAIVALAVCLHRAVAREPKPWVTSAIACIVLFAWGAWIRPPITPLHEMILARNAHEFLTLTLSQLAFPNIEKGVWAPLAWAPFLLLGTMAFLRRLRPDRIEVVLGTLAVWVIAQAAAVGYSRGGGMTTPPSRYFDSLGIGVVVNVMAAVLLHRFATTLRWKLLFWTCTIVWGGWVVDGLAARTREAIPDMALRKTWDANYVRNIQQFLTDDDAVRMSRLSYPWDLPVYDGALFANVPLSDPSFRWRLPPPLSEPLALTSSRQESDVFTLGGTYPTVPSNPWRPSWGSYSRLGNSARGDFISAPIRCRRRGNFVNVEIAGYLGQAGTALTILDLERGVTSNLGTPRLPRESWVPSLTRCPAGAFQIIARDDSPDWWFAFRMPAEYGPLSALALYLTDRWWVLLVAGGAIAWFAATIIVREPVTSEDLGQLVSTTDAGGGSQGSARPDL